VDSPRFVKGPQASIRPPPAKVKLSRPSLCQTMRCCHGIKDGDGQKASLDANQLLTDRHLMRLNMRPGGYRAGVEYIVMVFRAAAPVRFKSGD
jgi:hypothetical protein